MVMMYNVGQHVGNVHYEWWSCHNKQSWDYSLIIQANMSTDSQMAEGLPGSMLAFLYFSVCFVVC